MILDVPVMCVIMHEDVCVCMCAKCKGEDTSRDLGEIGQEVI